MSGFEHFRSKRVKKNKSARGSSGGIFLESILKGIEKQPPADKHFIWVKLDSKFFKLDRDIFLCCAYIPPSNSRYFQGNNTENDLIDLLRENIENITS